ncbi:unnamed protein product [Amoebophrya sp. A120]|nr:unnamed protein product [Amoebophrya sp. A120]|eukprot:GSA120T00018044001.1
MPSCRGHGAGTADCRTHMANICDTCNDGYHRNGDVCAANICTCTNGVGATLTECTTHDTAKCKTCDSGSSEAFGLVVEHACKNFRIQHVAKMIISSCVSSRAE